MIVYKDKKFIEANFCDEQELERVVIANYESFFGPSSVFIPKAKIKTPGGAGTVPDGFAVDLASRQWYIVEVELGCHSVWQHMAPQVAKQLVAASSLETKNQLQDIVASLVLENPSVREKFDDESIKEINVRHVLVEIFEKPPIIGLPIDFVSLDLRQWAETVKNEVRLWLVKKYTQLGNPHLVAYDIPDDYKPFIDTSKLMSKSNEVSLFDLIESRIIATGDQLIFRYKPRGGEQKVYKAVLDKDGTLNVLNQNFKSLSYAALACIHNAGSKRTTINGWTSWKTFDNKSLADLRSQYLEANINKQKV